MDIKEIYEKKESLIGKEIEVSGWIRNHRKQKEFGFIDFSDGTCFKHLQVVYDNTNDNFLDIQKYHIGSAIKVKGILVKSEGKEQDIEVKAKDVVLLGDCDEDYPMQPKRHTMEFLREQDTLFNIYVQLHIFVQEQTLSVLFLELEVLQLLLYIVLFKIEIMYILMLL